MNDNFQGSRGWRNSTNRDRRYHPPRLTGLQIAGEIVGWSCVVITVVIVTVWLI
jgi:hypothetical protein